MTIHYVNGTVLEAILLSRGNDTLRAAVRGEDDARTFTLIHGVWISEECDPVRIKFAWECRAAASQVPVESDCICSKQLASRLIAKLLIDSTDDNPMDDVLPVFSSYGQRIRIHQTEGASPYWDSALVN